jgi:hypothetical protein
MTQASTASPSCRVLRQLNMGLALSPQRYCDQCKRQERGYCQASDGIHTHLHHFAHGSKLPRLKSRARHARGAMARKVKL